VAFCGGFNQRLKRGSPTYERYALDILERGKRTVSQSRERVAESQETSGRLRWVAGRSSAPLWRYHLAFLVTPKTKYRMYCIERKSYLAYILGILGTSTWW